MTTSYNKGHKMEHDDITDTWYYLDNDWNIPSGTSEINGCKVYYDAPTESWRYAASDKIIDRPCKRCQEHSTPEGYDYCLGNLGPNVASACCGHGVELGFILFKDGRVFEEVAKRTIYHDPLKPFLNLCDDYNLNLDQLYEICEESITETIDANDHNHRFSIIKEYDIDGNYEYAYHDNITGESYSYAEEGADERFVKDLNTIYLDLYREKEHALLELEGQIDLINELQEKIKLLELADEGLE